ncbi:hypothetical protein [Streptomyces thermolilacinus]|uniref:hypothetical protein n=1 Tax=Streptomyces thermolilacinus TaxID=285540 RepID=UPI003410E189
MTSARAPDEPRAKVQGLVDVAIAIAGAAGGLASGVAAAFAGYPILAVLCGALAFVAAPAAIAAARKGSSHARPKRSGRDRKSSATRHTPAAR